MELLEGRNLNQTVREEGPSPGTGDSRLDTGLRARFQEAHDPRDRSPRPQAGRTSSSASRAASRVLKVLDFGLAKVTERVRCSRVAIILTQEGMVFGTPEFMSPEQAQGARSARERHLLARRHPL